MIALSFALLFAMRQDTADVALIATPPTARWELERSQAEVGEPFDATLIVEHAAGAKVELAPDVFALDTSWIEFAPARRAAHGSAAESRWSFSLASLEPGERELPELALSVVTLAGAKPAVYFQPALMTFAGVLGVDEDGPRPARDFRPVDADAAASRWPWIFGAALLAASAALLAWWMRRRRARQIAPAPSAQQRIDALLLRDLDARDSVRLIFYELTALVRAELDVRAQSPRDALTDEEWLRAAAAELGPEHCAALTTLFALARDAKYGAAHPTAFAVRDALAASKRVLETPLQPARSAA